MRLVFMGTPGFGVPLLRRLVAARYQVAAVYTQPDRPAGRGRAHLAGPIKLAALEAGLTVRQPDSFKSVEAQAELVSFRPEVIVVAAYGQLLPEVVLSAAPLGCLNVHPSLLPKYRGATPVPAAILAGEAFTGISLMLLDEGTDTGPLLMQAAVAVSLADNASTLSSKLSIVGAGLLEEGLQRYGRGLLRPRPQDDGGATYCARISRGDGELDWALPAEDLWRRVRAYNPWPGSYTSWRGKQLKILSAWPRASMSAPVGRIISLEGGAFGVGTGQGVLEAGQVQLAGKKAMSAPDFLKGQRGFAGDTLPS